MAMGEAASSASAAEGGSQSRRPGSAGPHYLAKCVLRGSAVLQAVQGHFLSSTSNDIVFGKEASLELVNLGEDGILLSVCEQTVFGMIKDLAILQWNETSQEHMSQAHGKDLLVVLSDSGKLSFLTFSTEMHRFYAVTHVELAKPGNSRHQLGRMLTVNSEASFVAISAYEDQFALFSVSMCAVKNIVDERYYYPSENGDISITRDTTRGSVRGTIWSMCFVTNDTVQLTKEELNPILAVIMHRKGAVSNDLFMFGCNRWKHSIYVISRYVEPGPLAVSISEIPHIAGIALLFRIGDVLFVDLRDPQNISRLHKICFCFSNVSVMRDFTEESSKRVDSDDEGVHLLACALLQMRGSAYETINIEDQMNIDCEHSQAHPSSKHVCSWSWEPGFSTTSKLIFSLDTGELFMIDIQSDVADITNIRLSDCLYRGLPCGILLWTGCGLIAGLVEMGDGMVLKLENGRLFYKGVIQNVTPILDLCVVDDHEEKQDQMFSCCGISPDGSLRIICSGISLENLLRTSPIYHGVTGIWTLRFKESDCYHSFLVLSFVEETRVLSVGLSFVDVSDAVGFIPDACTLACGLAIDGLLVQVHRSGVRLCLPTTAGHSEGVPLSFPICTSWCPDNLSISLGEVGHNLIVVATSNPCVLFILGIKSLSTYKYEIYEMQHVRLQYEVSCISIPREQILYERSGTGVSSSEEEWDACALSKTEFAKFFVIGTHKTSVEIFSFDPKVGFRVHAIGIILVNNALGTPIGGCIPVDVRFVSVDHPYVLAGLRNGMLLRFEWCSISPVAFSDIEQPTESKTYSCSETFKFSLTALSNMLEKADNNVPVMLQLVAVRRIGVTPVFLVPLKDSIDADIIVLSDRPWLLWTARHSLTYTSISFQSATHVAPVCSVDCPEGMLFVSENSLHLMEMIRGRRLNVQKLPIHGTPRKVLYHKGSKTLLVLRTGLTDALFSSDICCVDPLSGEVLSHYSCRPGEAAKCMQLVKVGKQQVLVVGTGPSASSTVMATGEAENCKGRLLVLSLDNAQISSFSSSLIVCSSSTQSSKITSPNREIVGYSTEKLSSSSLCSSSDDSGYDGIKLEEMEAGQLRLIFGGSLQGSVLSICPFLGRYFLASSGNTLNLFEFLNDNPGRLRKLAVAKTRFTITCLTTYFTTIAVGDCRDGILFFSYHEDQRKLEHIYSDPVQRLVADCALLDTDTAIVSDRRGTISILSSLNCLEVSGSPERNLMLNCSYYMGETVMSIQKGSFSYKLPMDDILNYGDGAGSVLESFYNSIVASTLLGSVFILIPFTSEEKILLETVQDRLAIHPLTSPVLGNDHKEFRRRASLSGTPTMLDGDMLTQFLELTRVQQEAVLASSHLKRSKVSNSDLQYTPISVDQVLRLLEKVHYALS